MSLRIINWIIILYLCISNTCSAKSVVAKYRIESRSIAFDSLEPYGQKSSAVERSQLVQAARSVLRRARSGLSEDHGIRHCRAVVAIGLSSSITSRRVCASSFAAIDVAKLFTTREPISHDAERRNPASYVASNSRPSAAMRFTAREPANRGRIVPVLAGVRKIWIVDVHNTAGAFRAGQWMGEGESKIMHGRARLLRREGRARARAAPWNS